MTKRLIAVGEKLRAARKEQGLSLRELAGRADVSASLLSQIECGKVIPSASSLFQIATALELPVHAFFPQTGAEAEGGLRETPEPTGQQANRVVKEEKLTYAEMESRSLVHPGQGQIQALPASGPVVHANARMIIELMGGVTWARLTPGTEEGMEFLEICYPPGYSSGVEMLSHIGREFGFVIEGELLMELAFERYQLKTGDSIIFDSTTPHRCSNAAAGTTRALWIRFTPLPKTRL